MPTGKHINENDIDGIVAYYKSRPMTISCCAEYFGLCSPTIMKALNARGVERYSKARVYNPDLKEDYFSKIDSEAKAYYLGLIITDGNVFVKNDGNNRQASISITQSESDTYILERFLYELRSNTHIGHDGRGTNCAAVRSNIIADDLYKYGIVPNKTLHSYLPDNIDSTLMHHLFRGILDGDGSIQSGYMTNGKHKHVISFCGTNLLMSQMREYLRGVVGVSPGKVYDYKNRNLSEFKVSSIKDMYKLGEWMYDGATIYLRRKRDAFSNFLEYVNSR